MEKDEIIRTQAARINELEEALRKIQGLAWQAENTTSSRLLDALQETEVQKYRVYRVCPCGFEAGNRHQWAAHCRHCAQASEKTENDA